MPQLAPESANDVDFRTLQGHTEARETLKKGGRKSPFPSLILGGPARIGKRLSAIWYAAFLNCLQTDDLAPCGECSSCKKILSGYHPDLHYTRVPEKKTVVGVSDVREAVHELHHAPFEGRFRVWIVEEGERLTDEAQNALLKTLEEPPKKAVILLVTYLEGALIPTVASRCRLLRFRGLTQGEIRQTLMGAGSDSEQAEQLAVSCGGALGTALSLLRHPKQIQARETILELFSSLPGQELSRAVETAHLLEKERNHHSLDQILEIGLSFYRDLLILSAGAEGLVVHRRRSARLSELASQMSAAAIKKTLDDLREAHNYARRHVSPKLLLQRLCINLSKGGH